MEMTAETVTDYLLKINAKKSTCPDGFSPKIIKLSAPAIATPLANLFNHCIGISALPSEWKMSNITPIHVRKKQLPTCQYPLLQSPTFLKK